MPYEVHYDRAVNGIQTLAIIESDRSHGGLEEVRGLLRVEECQEHGPFQGLLQQVRRYRQEYGHCRSIVVSTWDIPTGVVVSPK